MKNSINKIENSSSIIKKRIRTTFLNWQLLLLERHFYHQQYFVGEQRFSFAKFLGLNDVQVIILIFNRSLQKQFFPTENL